MQKRSATKKSHPNCWDISGAGHIRAEESVIDGAIRELKEELGVETKKKDLQYVATIYVSCEPCMMCMGAILYEEFSKVVYAATLQDSNDNYCPEMITNIDELAKYGNAKIEIIKELHREKAVEVLRMRGETE